MRRHKSDFHAGTFRHGFAFKHGRAAVSFASEIELVIVDVFGIFVDRSFIEHCIGDVSVNGLAFRRKAPCLIEGYRLHKYECIEQSNTQKSPPYDAEDVGEAEI